MDKGRIVEPLKRNIKIAYPWRTWVDGKAREVVHGVHFTCTQSSFITLLYKHAEAAGLDVTTRRVGRDKVQFQFERKSK